MITINQIYEDFYNQETTFKVVGFLKANKMWEVIKYPAETRHKIRIEQFDNNIKIGCWRLK